MCKFQYLIGILGEVNRGRLTQEVIGQQPSKEASQHRHSSILWNPSPKTAQKSDGQHEDFQTDT